MKKLILIAALFSISSFAADPRLTGNWKTSCSVEEGIPSDSVLTFNANGTAISIDRAYSTPDCSGAPAYTEASDFTYTTVSSVDTTLIAVKMVAADESKVGTYGVLSMSFNISLKSDTSAEAKLTAATLKSTTGPIDVPAEDVETAPSEMLTKF